MTLKLKIHQLAKVKDSEIEIKPFTIFFGESNTNKSYTLFSIYFYYKILKEKPFIQDKSKSVYTSSRNIYIKTEKERPDFSKIEKFLALYYKENIDEFFFYLLSYKLKNFNLEIQFSNDILDFYFKEFRAYFFPPSRTSIIDMQKTLLNISSYDIALPGLVKEFLKTYLPDLTPSYPIHDNFEDKTLKSLLIDILGGEVEHDISTNETFYKEKGVKIPITATASSIRELAPLYLTLRYNPINQKIYFIEEPEAHLHPSLQRKVAFLLAYIVNKGGKVFITTHSDYLVNTLSNLVKLWFLKKENEEKAKFIMKKFNIKDEFLLSPDKLGVYFFKKNENGKVNIQNIEANKYGISPESFLNTMEEDIELAEEILEAMD